MAKPVVVEQVFDAPVGKLWNAITDRDQMVKWYFEQIVDFRPEVGFKTQFSVVHEGHEYLHDWEVTEVVPGSRISYSWKYKGIKGEGAVTWELSPRGTGSALRLTNTGWETFPQDNPAFTRESCENGWRYFLSERLKPFLDS